MKLYSWTLKTNESRLDLIEKRQDVDNSILSTHYDGTQSNWMVGYETIKELIEELKGHNIDTTYYTIIEVSDDSEDIDIKFDNGCFFIFKLIRFVSEEEIKSAININSLL